MLKIEKIENEMDVRTESLIIEIHNYRADFKLKLDEYKMEFQKYWKILFQIKNIKIIFYIYFFL